MAHVIKTVPAVPVPHIEPSPSGEAFRIHIKAIPSNLAIVVENFDEHLTESDNYKVLLLRKRRARHGVSWRIPFLGAEWSKDESSFDITGPSTSFWNSKYRINQSTIASAEGEPVTHSCTVLTNADNIKNALVLTIEDGQARFPRRYRHLEWGFAIFRNVDGRWIRVSNMARLNMCYEHGSSGYKLKPIIV